MRKNLTTTSRDPSPENSTLVDLYPALALVSLVGYALWELAVLLP
jgi:hypothetical protein